MLERIQNNVISVGDIILVSDQPNDLHKYIDEYLKTTKIEVFIKKASELKIQTLCSNNFVLFITDSTPLPKQVNCNAIIKELERTFAYAWYSTLTNEKCSKNQVPTQHIYNDLYAWKFYCDKQKALPIHSFEGVIYRKSDLEILWNSEIENITQLASVWDSKKLNENKIGLFTDLKNTEYDQ
jgi:hypothetical protein